MDPGARPSIDYPTTLRLIPDWAKILAAKILAAKPGSVYSGSSPGRRARLASLLSLEAFWFRGKSKNAAYALLHNLGPRVSCPVVVDVCGRAHVGHGDPERPRADAAADGSHPHQCRSGGPAGQCPQSRSAQAVGHAPAE